MGDNDFDFCRKIDKAMGKRQIEIEIKIEK